jgi:serine/threonine protein kinase
MKQQNIVEFYHHEVTAKEYYFAIELCTGGDLENYCNSMPDKRLTEFEA